MMRHEAVETTGHSRGIPETWFKSLVDANNTFPVGSPIVCQAMAPTLFRSLITKEVSLKNLLNSQLSDEQLDRLQGIGNQQHDAFKVGHRVKTSDLANRWGMDMGYFSELAYASLEWLNTEKYGTATNPHVPENLPSLEFKELLKDPEQKEKLGLVLRVLYKASGSLSSPESQKATERHKHLLLIDPEYRKVQCANVALAPAYVNMRQAAEEEAAAIEQKRGIRIPDSITDWFFTDTVEPRFQKFL